MNAPIPTLARVQLTHAALQVVAEETGSRALHFKGPAVHPDLVGELGRYSTDADVLVHPDDVARYVAALEAVDFEVVTHFDTGSAFEHAASLWHDTLGWADIHRHYPGFGIPTREAFEVLWAERDHTEIAGQSCPVPDLTGQRLMLLLHAARSGGARPGDVERSWNLASDTERAQIQRLAQRLGAEVGLAAATGHLGDFANHPEHDLWHLFSTRDSSRLREWRARIKAAPTTRARLRLVLRSLKVNTDAMTMRLHRRPTRKEVVAEFLHRIGTAFIEVVAMIKRRFRRRK